MSLKLSEIWIYPIKSMAGIALDRADVLSKGLRFDRRFMLADDHGVAITQREVPQLALCRPAINDHNIEVRYGDAFIKIPLAPQSGRIINASVWGDAIQAIEVDEEISRWFCEALNISCRLLYFPEHHARPVDAKYQISEENVSLADAFPFLIIGESTLADLNERLDSPIPMNRFRPNFVFSGGKAFAEDTWFEFSIGDCHFTAMKRCARCIIITTDQETTQRSAEPLRTLATYRGENNKVYFGQNVLHRKGNSVKIGDEINVHSYKS